MENNGPSVALSGGVGSDFGRYQDSARSVEVSVSSEVIVRVIVNENGFVEGDGGEGIAHPVVRAQAGENVLQLVWRGDLRQEVVAPTLGREQEWT